MRPQADTDWLIATAQALGFDLCGVAPASELTEPEHRDEWLARGYAGQMKYLHDARRADPLRALPEAKSIIVCAINYNTAQPYSTEAAALAAVGGGAQAAAASGAQAWISRYAWGDDYHTAIGEKLESLIAAMTERFGDDFLSRAYVDTGPISERVAARQAGLGWLAKNTCLINEEIGSWLFLGVVLTSLDLAPSLPHANSGAVPAPPADLCGNCTMCLQACPTGALVEPYVLDARRCISYLTIELRDSIPEELRAAMGWQVFGCDICQDVCPWNRQAPASTSAAFTPRENFVAPEIEWLLSLTEEDFRRIFKDSAVRRTKWRGLIRNACIAAGNARGKRARKEVARGGFTVLQRRLTELAASADPIIAEHAQWALAQWRVAGADDSPGAAEASRP
jgi:epoxyqueuosine reductase